MEDTFDSFGALQTMEVLTLPKEIESKEIKSLTEFVEDKQVRHDSTLEQMKQALLKHSEEFEKQLQVEVELIREELQLFKKSLEDQHDSLCLNLNSEDEWIKVLESVPEQDAKSQKIISEFTKDLHSMEKNRVDKIKSILRTYRKGMVKIAYLSPENIETLLKEELEAVNKTVAANTEKHSDIILELNGLRTVIIECYKDKMKNSFQMWMENLKNNIIASFRQSKSMEESITQWSEIISNDEASSNALKEHLEIIESMVAEIDNTLEYFEKSLFGQNIKCYHSKDILDVIEHFGLCGSKIVKHFQSAVGTIIDGYNEYLSQMQKLCEEDISNLQNYVLSEGSFPIRKESYHSEDTTPCQPQRLREIVDIILSKNITNEAEWQNLVETVECNIMDMMKFIERIKVLWLLYQEELAGTINVAVENMEKVRQARNKEEEELNKKLNILLDTQRKESTPEKLDKTTQSISALLNKFKERHEEYYSKEKEAIKQFLPLLMKKAPGIKTEIALILEDFDKYDIKYSKIVSSDFATHVMDETPIFTNNCERREFCISLINAANNWKLGLYERLEYFQEKCDCFLIKGAALWISSEINTLTQQLIKKMRTLEAKRNVMLETHNMRAAELCWHSNRLTAHIQGVRQVIDNLKQQVFELKAKENEMKSRIEASFKDLNTTQTLSFCEAEHRVSQFEEKLTEMQNVLNQAAIEQTTKCVETFQRLHDSNTNYMKAMKLFTAGGNFSQEEIKTMTAQLKNLDKEMKAENNKLLKQCKQSAASTMQKESKEREEAIHRRKDLMKNIKLTENKKEHLDGLQIKLAKEINKMKQDGEELCEQYNSVCKKCSSIEQWNNLVEAVCNRCSYLLLPKGTITLEMCSVQEHMQRAINTGNESLFRSTDVSRLSQNDSKFIAVTKLMIAQKLLFLRNMAQNTLNLQPASKQTNQSGTRSKGKYTGKQKHQQSDEFSVFMDSTIDTLKMYNLYCEKQWLQQVQEFLEQIKDIYETLNSFMDCSLTERHNQCMTGIDLLVKTHQACSSDFWDEAHRERNKMDRGLLPLHGHPHWKNQLKEMSDEARSLVRAQLQTQKSILERYKNALQDSYRNYVSTLRPVVESLTSLQEKAFNEENKNTMFKQIKSVLQKLIDSHKIPHPQASLVDTITLEGGLIQGTLVAEPTALDVTKCKTSKLGKLITLATIINNTQEIIEKLSYPQDNEISEGSIRITLLSFDVQEKAFKNIRDEQPPIFILLQMSFKEILTTYSVKNQIISMKIIAEIVQERYNKAQAEHHEQSEKWKQWLHTWFHNIYQIKKLYVL